MTTEFRIGDAVVDVESDPSDRGTLRVVGYVTDPDADGLLDRLADGTPVSVTDVTFTDGDGTERTVASVNREEYADEYAVAATFEGWLEGNMPGWETVVDEPGLAFPEWLVDMEDTWGIPLRDALYTYPEARLMPRPVCWECGEREDWSPDPSKAPGYYCTNPECERGVGQ